MNKGLAILALFVCWRGSGISQGSWTQTSSADFGRNINFNIDCSNNELRLTNDLGTGADGDLYVPPAASFAADSVRTYVTGENPSGQNAIQVYSSAGFTVGDEVLVITMQDNNADLNNNHAGQFEFKRVTRTLSAALYFSEALKNSYDAAGKKHQVIRVPNYSSITIDGGGVLTCADWDGRTGGVLAFRSKAAVTVLALGKIDVSGKGYAGGASVTGTFARGIQGESILGAGTAAFTNNLDAGGGGYVGNYYQLAGGGGGGLGDSGRDGEVCGYMSNAGQAGIPVGDIFLGKLLMGGGGGSGATDGYVSSTAGKGGDGGGILYVSADSINVVGYCLANGQSGDGYSTSPRAGGGGGGSGGTIFLISHRSMNLGNRFVRSIGGSGGHGTDAGCNNGGSGGAGRIRCDAPAVNGASEPAAGYEGTSLAFEGVSTSPPIAKSGAKYWGQIEFTKDSHAPGTSVKVDVLSTADSVLLADVDSGLSMNEAGVPPTLDSIRLRARLLNAYGNQTPRLLDWRVEWLPTAVRDRRDVLPAAFSLERNYPNPFNPTTTIRYGLPEESRVMLKVYDILGREAAVLVNGRMEAGYHEAVFDASSVPSGIYLYRLQAGGRTETRTLVVMK